MVANRQLIVGLAATFVGLTAVLAVGGVVLHPLLLAVAVPFGLTAYFLWYHATGRLADRVRREAGGATTRDPTGARQRARAATNRRAAFTGGRTGNQTGGRTQHRGRQRGQRRGHRRGRAEHDPTTTDGPTMREAYATLDLQPDASEADVKRAYREKAKELHPDTEGGDQAAFKNLTAAYDLLLETETAS